ncbi:MAG TPA: polysaccharide pyruvyl transferase family protein [Candidatus Merdisoma merdipullorum]|nr:polysaccharide pyruvyl transferase family protein [Candidatus Merdisoma merdipullorum]
MSDTYKITDIYNICRKEILKYDNVFQIISFAFTPVRVVKEYYKRRKRAIQLIKFHRNVNRNEKKIFYFGIPEHTNLGDMAQMYCIKKWVADNYPNYKVIEINTNISFDNMFLNYIKKILGPDDIFLFQSGYCTTDKHLDHYMHIKVMKKFPNQKSVILPQTVNLKSAKTINKSKNVFAYCGRLLFIARDNISYERAKYFIDEKQLEIFPDIVTSLIGKYNTKYERKGVLFCVRNDHEKFYKDDEINIAIAKLKKDTEVIDKADTNSYLKFSEIYKKLEAVIVDKINSFAKYEVVITDRYHGVIFSLIANTPVIVIKTNDHKVIAGMDWFKGIYDKEAIYMAKDLDDAIKVAELFLKRKKQINNTDYFYQNYYKDKLRERINLL